MQHLPLFADLSPAELKRVAGIVNEQIFNDGDRLAEQGESGDEMYIIVSGEVRILIAVEIRHREIRCVGGVRAHIDVRDR